MSMPILTVRNLRSDVHQKLREQAARNGRSMEAEARVIIEEAVDKPRTTLVDRLSTFAERAQLTDEEISIMFPPRSSDYQRPIEFGES